jgi:hypothetical protein
VGKSTKYAIGSLWLALALGGCVGDLVGIYVMNMLDRDPIASFHLHAQTFDLYRSGTWLIRGYPESRRHFPTRIRATGRYPQTPQSSILSPEVPP